MQHNLSEGKLGVLCLSPEEGLGVTDPELRERHIDRVTVVGLATDYCVKHTALDALRHGFEVQVDSEGIRGVEVEPGDSERALEEMRRAGAAIE